MSKKDLFICSRNIPIFVNFIYSEKATKFCEISTVDLTGTTYVGQIYGGDFAKFCGLLKTYELQDERIFATDLYESY